MTPYEIVKENFDVPLTLYPFQEEAVNELSPLPSTGLYFEPGLGKTLTSTVMALYKRLTGSDIVLILMPPLLISQWARWLSRIKNSKGQAPRVVCYRGSPAQRKQISFDADFVLMGLTIFKIDHDRVVSELGRRKVHVILDEAQAIKDVGTDNYKFYRDFVSTQSHTLLTGTPLNRPDDAYSYIKLVAPSIYRNLNQFNQIHIKERDFFGNAVSYQNLELLRDNLLVNANRKTKEEVLLTLPTLTIQPLEYDLDKRHLALYRKLANEQLLKLPDGGKLDMTQANSLYHALGQIVMGWSHFAQDESLKAEGYKLVEEVLDELGNAKLIVFGNYIRTNQELVRRFNCPGIWGEISGKQKEKAIDTFITDDKCRLIVLNPIAGGVGVEGLQAVSSDALYVEPPITPAHWTQSISRIHRDGQTKPVVARMATAIGTIQQHLVKNLSAKDSLVQPLQGSRAMLQAALFGEELSSHLKAA